MTKRLVLLFGLLLASLSPALRAAPCWAAVSNQCGVYRVPPQARSSLLELNATVYHSRIEGDFIAELTELQAESLREQGFEVRVLARTIAEWDEQIRQMPSFESFHTYDEIRNGLYACAAAHPEIARIQVLGSSVEGREILALEISDHVPLEEDEPELAFWGGIHGNEYAGAEMPYLYALYLCDHYGSDLDVTRLVNENEIWCIPMINPDGRVHGRRTNMHGIDLNRDFGYQWNGEGASPSSFSQPETRAVREFCTARDICLSTTFHCSGDIVFYPWGYWPHDVPDLEIILEVGGGYATAASYSFGNSWADYETHGELLDDLYGSHGGICYTVEISNQATILPQTFERNRLGMNWLCAQAGEGLHGTVSDAGTGEPLVAALWISGNPIPSYSAPGSGAVHRVVSPGTYDVTVWANGYEPVTAPGVVVTRGVPGVFQASLSRGTGEHAFAVTAVNQKDPHHLYRQATYPSRALGGPDGMPCSLGSGGFIVLDLGEGHDIVDGPGDDFVVTEAFPAVDPLPETYRVYAGDAYSQSVLVGAAVGTASFDLAGSGLSSTRHLRIQDESGSNPDLPYAGMELDGIAAMHTVSTPVALLPPDGPGPAPRLAISPNPLFSSSAARPTIRFALTRARTVQIDLYDVRGRLVSRLLPAGPLEPGQHEITLDGSGLNSGVYICRLRSGEERTTAKLVVLE